MRVISHKFPTFLPIIVKTSDFEEIYASLPCSIPDDSDSLNFVRDIVVNFVESLDYRRRDPILDITTTYESLRSEFTSLSEIYSFLILITRHKFNFKLRNLPGILSHTSFETSFIHNIY